MADFLPDLARIGLRSVVDLVNKVGPRRSGFGPFLPQKGAKMGQKSPKKAVSEIDRQSILEVKTDVLINLATTFWKKCIFCTFL